MKTVSIIIPTYNREHLLCRAAQSVLDQTYQDFELIIIDDGSTDNTKQVVESFSDERVKYIQHGKNKGGAAARNTGIKAAKGEYIAFQDSDDEWLPEKLEKQMMAFETAAPEVGVVYVGCHRLENNKKNLLPSSKVAQKEGDIFSALLKENFVAMPAVLVKRGCFERAGMFDENFSPIEDWELFLRMARDFQFRYIDEPLVISYHQPDSITGNQRAIFKPLKLILETYFEDIKQDKRVLASYYFRLGNYLCPYGELREGRSCLVRSFKAYPLDIKVIGAFLASLLGQRVYNTVVKIYREILARFQKSE